PHSPKKQQKLIQNAAARFLTRSKKEQSIIPILKSSHWHPAKHRLDLKAMLLVYTSLHGSEPKYISDVLEEFRPTKSLRSEPIF
ncbi:hypothetical protein LDENG_00211030, partial [Lucifuga dentata]